MVIRVSTHSGARGVNSFGSTAPGLDKLSVIGSVDLGLVIYVHTFCIQSLILIIFMLFAPLVLDVLSTN